MRRWFCRAGSSSFRKADLTETTEELSNPARGWYQIHTFQIEEEPDLEEQRWSLHPLDTLVLVLIDIGSCRDRDLDTQALGRIHRILNFFAERRYDCIVRAVYDHEGKAAEREPFFFSQVLRHLQQIMDVVRVYASSVFVFQGMLVGNWGEMHTSRYLSEEHMRRMAEILRSCRGEDTWLAVRRPDQWRVLHEEQAGKEPVCSDGMGLFDDGIFGSDTHLGTFGIQSQKYVSWDCSWCREEELEFENRLCRQAPNGGEAVYGEDRQGPSQKKVLEVLKKMQITYLNRAHDTRILDLWKQQRYSGRGVWSGKSLFDYIGAHLGYRFLIRNVQVTDCQEDGGGYMVETEIENTGFAGFYQEGRIELEYTDRTGRRRLSLLDCRLKGWAGGEKRKLACTVDAGDGALLLTARRNRDDACIHFANPSDQEGKAVLGYLRGKGKDPNVRIARRDSG